jgi:DNA polymerase
VNSIETIAALYATGGALRREGDALRLIGRYPQHLADAARQHKATILAHLDATPIYLDFETRSHASIKLGGRRYAADPTTQIMSCVFAIDNRIIIWTPGRFPPAITWPTEYGPERPVGTCSGNALPQIIADAIDAGRLLCAHNALGFERWIWQAKRLPEPIRWIDTIPWARAAGCPGSLDGAASWLLDKRKDAAGEALIKKYCAPYGKAKKYREPDDKDGSALIKYNLIDVLLLEQLYDQLRHYDREPELLLVDQRINERGVRVDTLLPQRILELADTETARLASEAERLTNGAVKATDLRRVAFLTEWLQSRGIVLDQKTAKGTLKLDKAIADTILGGSPPDDVRAVLEARRATARTTVGKLSGALNDVDGDCRLRHQFQYHNAHTGRWSSRGVQLQNLPRPKPAADVEALLDAYDAESFRAALNGVSFADGLSALIRPTFVPALGQVLVISDFTSIEARGLAWCAGEEWVLDRFRHGEDLYCAMAGKIFGRPITKVDKREREIGKATILGSGYGLGDKGFERYCEANKIDLDAAGLTATDVIATYRGSVPKIAGQLGEWGRFGGLWKDVERAAKDVIGNHAGEISVGRCRIGKKDGNLVITLPSGRPIYYRHPRLERRKAPWGAETLGIVYDAPGREGSDSRRHAAVRHGHGVAEYTYGGKLVENIVQAICRDLLAASMIACERARLPVVMHAHDEIAIEVPAERAENSLNQLLMIMSAPPAWADGFPVEVEGYISTRYTKQPVPASSVRKARNGQVLV